MNFRDATLATGRALLAGLRAAETGITQTIDRSIAIASPHLALKRQQYRGLMAYYEAVKPTRLRRARVKDGTGDAAVSGNAHKLRAYARDLERNHDLARGAINRLVQNIVGPAGIAVEPQPRTKTGEIHEDMARQILALWRDWAKRPEVTWSHDWPSAQRALCRAWVRDGEALAQMLAGTVPYLDHGTRVPLSIELFESDSLPLDYSDEGLSVVQGVERNAWGRSTGYYFYKTDPSKLYRLATVGDLKRVPADRVLHVKLADRLLQARGVSIFASVLTRLDDIKDYEESERIAAKVAASMAAMIKKGTPDQYQADAGSQDENGDPIPRNLKFRPGMVFDDLLPGESIETIDTKRPNPVLEAFRNGQLRAAAAGLDVSYSSLARDYNGTYSAQRQELVEQWAAYAVLSAEFGARMVRPVYERFLLAALAAGLLKLPADLDPASLDDAILIAPQMPWIDPEKEANAALLLENSRYASGPEIIRRRGQNPRDVLEQEANWQKLLRDKGLLVDPKPAADANARRATTTVTQP
jgi:lambda family phage portal protein